MTDFSDETLRIWSFYDNEDTWDWYPIRQWKQEIIDLWMTPNYPRHEARKKILAYFMNGGMSPYHAIQAILAHWPGKFDQAAIRYMESFCNWKENEHAKQFLGKRKIVDPWDMY